MTGQPPSSALPWAWTIEALASFKEVNITTLIDVFKRSPDISSDVGSNAREMASFRTLERLFDQDTQPITSISSTPISGVGFDSSERCEDVLRHILGEMRVPTIWDESEKSKWDAQPFLAFKRPCLFKWDLQQNTHVEGRFPRLAALKQKVTSVRKSQSRISHDVSYGRFNSQKLGSCVEDEVCQDKSNEGNGEAGDDGEKNTESKSSSDDEWYQKEMNDIQTKKQVFFSSKCSNRELGTHWNEGNGCMKCHKGGPLLVCSSDGCSFVFHNSCLVSESFFDGDLMGKFYCPFCTYSQAISDFHVLNQKASLARNELVSFNGSTLKHKPKVSPERFCVSEQSPTREDKVVDEKIERINNGERNNVLRVINGVSNLESSESSGSEGCHEEVSKQADSVDRSMSIRKQIKPW